MNFLPQLSLILLTLGALLGNYFSIPLFYGVDLLFGSIFVFLTLLLHGRRQAVVIALISSSYTYQLWGHPYAIILFTLEAIWLGWVATRSKNWDLPLWDITYWLLIGIPLIWVFYYGLMSLSTLSTSLIAVKQFLNSVLNALIATQIFYGLPRQFLDRIAKSRKEKEFNIRQLIANLLITLLVLMMISFTVWEGYTVKNRIEKNLAHHLQSLSQTLNSQTQNWLQQHQLALQQIAQRKNLSADKLNFFRQFHSHFEQVYLTNAEGRIIHASSRTEQQKDALLGVNVSQQLSFQKLQRSPTETVTQLQRDRPKGAARRDRADSSPYLSVAVARSSPETFSGMVYVELSITPLKNKFEQILSNWSALEQQQPWQKLEFTLCDEQGQVIFSNQPESGGGKRFPSSPEARQPIANQLRQILPANASHLPDIIQWEQSTYRFEQPFSKQFNWQLQLELPAAYTVQAVRENYTRYLLLALVVMAASFAIVPSVTSWLTTPLREIADNTTNLPQKLTDSEPIAFPASRVKEIRQLAENSQTMANQLKAEFGQIKGTQEQLENQVQSRTLELEQALSSLYKELARRRKTAQQLAASEARFRYLVENAPLPISMADSQGQLLFVNPAYMETLGYSYEEIINKNIADFAHPEDFQQEKPLFEELVTGKRDIYQIEERFIHKNGDPIWVSLTISANRDQEGNFISTIEMFENISTKKSYEEGLKQANAELEQANRLKDEFLATMSHELRTPLNSILGMTEGLQEQIYGPLNGKQLKCLDTVQNSGTHLLALINDILDLSKIEAGKLEVHQERISISELCQSTVSLIEESASKKNIALNTEVSQQVSVLEGDEQRLRQALLNLLSNAVKFTPEQGTVTLKVALINENSDVAFSVIDTGIGIAPENFPNLFEPFTQVDSKLNRQQGGTGLGLSLVKRIAELHGGDVTVESTVGEGSCFTLTIPYRGTTPSLETAQGTESSQGLPTLLIVGHQSGHLMTMSSYLEATGYSIITAETLQSAISSALEQQPDFIILDVEMAEMDRLEAIRQLRAESSFRETPIIALTDVTNAREEEKCLEAGANYYLTKPIRLRELVSLLEEMSS